MPTWCSVSSCGNRSDQTSNVSYHRFPKSEKEKKFWILFCGKGLEWVPSVAARVCSSHFRTVDFERNLQSELLGGSSKRILKKGVVPRITNDQNNIEVIFEDSDKEDSTDSATVPQSPEEVEVDYKNLYSILLNENQQLRLETSKLTYKNRQVQQKLKALGKSLCSCRRELLKTKIMEKKIKRVLKKVLSENQIGLLLNKKKRVNWKPAEVSTAFTLRYYSKKSYIFLKNHLGYPLPSLSSLRRWALGIQMKQGILPDILNFMRLAGEDLSEMQKCAVLQYDELKVNSVLEFDNAEDEIVGPYTYMQVIMVRGLFSKWKQPIFIDFDRKITKDTLMEIINELYDISYTVVACVSGCEGGNVGLWKELNVGIDKSYFRHPKQQSNIYMFADAPHLLKLVRNWLVDTGFVLEDGSKITKTPLESLVKLADSEVNVCFRINENHLTCEETARQNVRQAAELLSNTTATALIHYDVGNKTEARALSKFIEAVNKWFDVFNSYIPMDKVATKSAYGNNIEEQNQILNDMKNKLFKIKAMGKNSLQTLQKGMIMSINSLKMLFVDMNQKFSASYILTHRLNQDSLEQFFFQVRNGCGIYDHPSPLDALSRVRMIILGKNPEILESQTCTEDQQQDEYMVAQMFHRANVSINSASTVNDNYENDPSSSSSTSQEPINPVVDSGPETTGDDLEYIAGYIAKKYNKKYPCLGDHTCKYSIEHDYSLPTWVRNNYHDLSYGGLVKPTEWWKSTILKFNVEFEKFHQDLEHGLRKGKGVTKKLIWILCRKHNEIPKEVIQTFVELRTIIRIKYINLKSKSRKRKSDGTGDEKRSRLKKTKKFIN